MIMSAVNQTWVQSGLIPRPCLKIQEKGLVTPVEFLIRAKSVYYVTIVCLL